MDQDALYFLLLMGGAAGSVLQQRYSGWQWIGAGVMAAGLVARLTIPAGATLCLLGLWSVFILTPLLFARAVNRAVARRQFDRAYWLNGVVASLHPLDGWPQQHALLRALRYIDRGQWDQAEPLLRANAHRVPQPHIGLSAVSYLCARTGDWRPLLDDPRLQSLNPDIVAFRFQALSEMGQIEAMIDLYDQVFAGTNPPRQHGALIRLRLLAFGGRPDAVGALFRTTLRQTPSELVAIWLATARIAAGGAEAEAGLTAMRDLARGASPEIRRAAAQRLAHPPMAPCSESARDRLDRLAKEVTTKTGAGVAVMPMRATLGLGVAILIGFALEIAGGGAEAGDALYRLGGLWPRAVLVDGDWWRLVAALFLHAGPIHLFSNLALLGVLGWRFERVFGSLRFLVIYLVTGVASLAGILLATQLGWIAGGLTVGASGALTGIVGALVGAYLRRVAGVWSIGFVQRLAFGVAAIGLQALFDIVVPHISFTGHAAGFVAGFLLGLTPWAGPKAAARPAEASSIPALTRRQIVSYGFVAAVFAATLAIYRRDQTAMAPSRPRSDTTMTEQLLSFVRRVRFARAGRDSLITVRADMLTSADPPVDDSPISDSIHWRIMAAIPAFCARARLAPGRYAVHPSVAASLRDMGLTTIVPLDAEGRFQFTDDHAQLIRAISWHVVTPENALHDWGSNGTVRDVTHQDGTFPYGGSQNYLPYAVAEALGFWIERGPQHAQAERDAFARRMFHIHLQLFAALPIFFQHATWPDPVRGPA